MEVEEKFGKYIENSRKRESNKARHYRRKNISLEGVVYEGREFSCSDTYWCCIIKVDTLFSRILIYNHNQYENRRKIYGTESKIL